jgi:hypothetical protein
MPSSLFLKLIAGYRRWISPMLPPACRFHPSCSEYAAEAVDRHGAARGAVLAARRLARCHPWCEGGVDPVPPRARNEHRAVSTISHAGEAR